MDQPFESDVMEDLAANSSFGDEGAFDAWDGMEGEGVLCPIVRGKAGKSTEFGAKLSVSCVDNYVFLHRLSWENFNESQDLKAQVENFKETYGC